MLVLLETIYWMMIVRVLPNILMELKHHSIHAIPDNVEQQIVQKIIILKSQKQAQLPILLGQMQSQKQMKKEIHTNIEGKPMSVIYVIIDVIIVLTM